MAFNLRQKSNWLFAQIAMLTIALTVLFGTFFYKIYKFSFAFLGQLAISRVQSACGCQISSSPSSSLFTGIIILLGITIITSFLVAFFKTIISIKKTQRFINLQKINFVKTSAKLEQVANTIGINGNITEINTNRPFIFCHGLKNPQIYISSSVVQTLTYAELQAVLLHETHHLLTQEPARLLCIKFLSGFSFIPGIQSLTKKYLSFSEMAADELATNNFKEKNHLASAMGKILDMEEKTIIQKELAVSYFSQITEERILVLSQDNYKPSFKREVLQTVFGIAVALSIVLFFTSKINTQQARAQETYSKSNCANKVNTEQCANAWTKCADKIYHTSKIGCTKPVQYLNNSKK